MSRFDPYMENEYCGDYVIFVRLLIPKYTGNSPGLLHVASTTDKLTCHEMDVTVLEYTYEI